MKTEIILITDASGSMQSLSADVVGGYNQLLQDQKELPGEARWSAFQFNDSYRLVCQGINIARALPLNLWDYSPGGGTALYDAIGKTMESQGKRIADEKWADKVIVAIQTDGQENASREYRLERIKSMIEHARSCNWEFVFLGANIDAFAVSHAMGMSAAYTQNYAATPIGTRSAYVNTSSLIGQLRTEPTESNIQWPAFNI